MAATTAASPSYSWTRPSVAATRSLVDSEPSSTTHSSGTATPSNPASPHGTLHRRKTNNYESALSDRLTAAVTDPTTAPEADDASTPLSAGGQPPTVHAGLAYRGDAGAAQQQKQQSASSPTGPVTSPHSDGDRPSLGGVLGRQQSFKQGDQKRAQMERMLSDDGSSSGVRKGGYSTSQQAT